MAENEASPETSEPKRPGALRRWLVRPLAWGMTLVAFTFLAGVLYLKTPQMQERLRAFLAGRLSDALARPVTVGAAELSLWPLSLAARDLVIPGPEPGARPVAIVPRVRIDASLSGFTNPELRIDRVWLEEPLFFLEVGAHGRTNLPHPPPSGAQGGQNLEIRIGDLVVRGGRFDLNELTVPLDLEARGIELQLHGSPGADRADPDLVLAGRLAVGAVAVELPAAAPWQGALRAGLRIGGGTVAATNIELSGPHLAAQAEVTYTFKDGEDRLLVQARGQGDLGFFEEVGYLPPGEVRAAFDLGAELAWNDGEWLLEGTVDAPEVEAGRRRFEAVHIDVSGRPEALTFEVGSAAYAGGTLTGPVRVGLGKRPTEIAVELAARELDLQAVLADLGVRLPSLAGTVSGPLSYRFTADRPFDGEGSAEISFFPEAKDSALNLVGEAKLTAAGGALRLPRMAELESSGQDLLLTRLEVDLETGDGELDLSVLSEDLGPLATLIPGLPPGALWLPTAGRGEAGALIRWRGAAVEAAVDFDLTDVRSPGARAESLRGSLKVSGEAVSDLALSLRRGAGSLELSGRVPFDGAAEGFGLGIEARDWPFEEVRAFVPVELPLAGPISGSLSLTGTTEHLAGRLDARLLEPRVGPFAAQDLAVRLTFDPEVVRFEEARLRFPAGEVAARGRLDLAGTEAGLELEVSSNGLELSAEPLAPYAGALSGRAELLGTLRGTLARPDLTVHLGVPALAVAGRPAGAAVIDGAWREGELTAKGELPGLLSFAGGGRLDLERGESGLEFRLSGNDLGGLIAAFSGKAVAELAGSFAGVLAVGGSPQKPDLRLALERLEARYGGLDVVNLEPVRARLGEGAIVLESLYLGERGGPVDGVAPALFLGGKVGLQAGLPLDLNLEATLPARWLEALAPDLRVTGSINALGKIRGLATAPELDGQADLAGARVLLAGFPHSLEDLRAVVLVYPEQAILDSFSGRLAGGEVRASGTFALAPDFLADYRLQAEVRGFSLRYPEGWSLEGGARLTLEPLPGGRIVEGRVDLTRALYLDDVKLNLFELLGGFLRRQRIEVGVSPDSVLATTQLSIDVKGPRALRVTNNVADLAATPDLTVRGTLARPIPVGTVEAEAGGKIVYGENEYQLENGRLTFLSRDRIDPIIDLVARSRVRDYEVSLALSGTLERLNASFSSNPPLPDLDVLALLAGGERLSETAPATAGGTGLTGAEAFLYGQAASAIGARVKTLFGFDRFRIDPTAATGGSVDTARLLLGKQISRDLYVTYQTGLSSRDQSLVQAEWRVSPGLVVVLSAAGQGNLSEQLAVDLRWERRLP